MTQKRDVRLGAYILTSVNRKLLQLALRHCLRFSCAVFPGGATADNRRGRTACKADGYTPPTSPGKLDFHTSTILIACILIYFQHQQIHMHTLLLFFLLARLQNNQEINNYLSNLENIEQ